MRAPSPALIDGSEGFAAAGVFCAGAGPFVFAAARTSVSVTRPSGPVPLTLARSTPSSAATRRATGDAFIRASSPLSIFATGAASFSFFSAGTGFSVSACGFFSLFSSAFGSFGFSSSLGASSFFGASSPSPPMNAILSPTFTFPPSST